MATTSQKGMRMTRKKRKRRDERALRRLGDTPGRNVVGGRILRKSPPNLPPDSLIYGRDWGGDWVKYGFGFYVSRGE